MQFIDVGDKVQQVWKWNWYYLLQKFKQFFLIIVSQVSVLGHPRFD